MYLEMIDTILGIEFYEGIPSEIDSHDFFDVNKRNVIILDDLMAQSGGDIVKIYFIKERKQETSALIHIILYSSSFITTSSKYQPWQDKSTQVGFLSSCMHMKKLQEKSALYSNEYHRFQTFKQLQSNFKVLKIS